MAEAREETRRQRWRREVASTTVGVLIALALGAVASEIGWRLEVRTARASLREELGEILGQARERERTEPCYRARLDRIARILDRAEADGRLPPIAAIGQPTSRTWSRGVWDSIQSAETAAHMDRTDLDNLSGVYEFMDVIRDANARELEDWATLATIIGPGRRLSDAEAAQLRGALSRARSTSNLMAYWSVRIRQVADAFALPYDSGTYREYGEGRLATASICRPLRADVPPGYGLGTHESASDIARATPITRAAGISRSTGAPLPTR